MIGDIGETGIYADSPPASFAACGADSRIRHPLAPDAAVSPMDGGSGPTRSRQRTQHRLARLGIALTLLLAAGPSVATPARISAAAATSLSHLADARPAPGPGAPTVRHAGSTDAVVVAYKGDVSPSLLTPATLGALGARFHNTVGHGGGRHLAPLPVLLLGTASAPTIKAALATIKRLHPVRIYLLGMKHTQRLTLVTNTLYDGLSVFINKTPGRITSTAALVRAIAAAPRFKPVIVHGSTGSRLVNAAEVDASTQVTPPDPTAYAAYELPSTFLPPVGDQGNESSCVGWSTSYYYKTFQEAKKYGWSPNSRDHIFSPSFIYNQINGGQDKGSNIADALAKITQTGDVPFAAFPYVNGDYTTQPAADLLAVAQHYHAADFGYLYVRNDANSPAPDLTLLKRWLSGGDGLVIGLQVPSPSFNNYNGGVYDGPADTDTALDGHAMFVVGYDDNVDGTGYGAFRVINSWTTQWGDNGYGWLSYDYLSRYLGGAWVMANTPNAVPPSATSVPAPATPNPQPTVPARPRPQPTPPPAPPVSPAVIYAATGSSTLAPNPANRDFIATLTFTFVASDAQGKTVERHRLVYHAEVDGGSDTAFTLRYTMNDGTVATAQVEVQAGNYTG